MEDTYCVQHKFAGQQTNMLSKAPMSHLNIEKCCLKDIGIIRVLLPISVGQPATENRVGVLYYHCNAFWAAGGASDRRWDCHDSGLNRVGSFMSRVGSFISFQLSISMHSNNAKDNTLSS